MKENNNNKIGILNPISKNLIETFKCSSSIIENNIDYQKLIIKWIQEKTNRNISQIKLIFKMSVNGNMSKDFHKHCDKKGLTLIITKTSNNKIFGGFTILSWEVVYKKINQIKLLYFL